MTFGIAYEHSSGGAEDRLNTAVKHAAAGHTTVAESRLRDLRDTSNEEYADSLNTAIAFRARVDYHLGAIGIEQAAHTALTTQNNTARDEMFWSLFRRADRRLEDAAAQAKALADDRYKDESRYQSDFRHMRSIEAWLRGLRGEGLLIRAAFNPREDMRTLLGRAGVQLAEAVNLANEAGDHEAFVLNAMRTARLARMMGKSGKEYRRTARRRMLRALPTRQAWRCIKAYARVAPSLGSKEKAEEALKHQTVLNDKPPTHRAMRFRRRQGGPK